MRSSSITSIQNLLGGMFLAIVFLGSNYGAVVQPVVDHERTVFYRYICQKIGLDLLDGWPLPVKLENIFYLHGVAAELNVASAKLRIFSQNAHLEISSMHICKILIKIFIMQYAVDLSIRACNTLHPLRSLQVGSCQECVTTC